MAFLMISSVSSKNPTSTFTQLRYGVTTKTHFQARTAAAFGGGISYHLLRCCPAAHFCNQKLNRRSGNYGPPNWDYELLQSLKHEHAGQVYIERARLLREQVKTMLDEDAMQLNQLELIDNMQRLGISYHFEDKIQSILCRIYTGKSGNYLVSTEKDLYATALEFRLLRQHGFYVSQEIFECFRDEQGRFKSSLCEDSKGMLYLLEASFLLTESENISEMAQEFAAKQLKKSLDEKIIDQELALLVQHALELPLHWRMLRLEARWFIDIYEKRSDMNPTMLEFAKLDFNIVQATHQNDLKDTLDWWTRTRLAEKLPFSRDRLVENFFWTVGVIFDPHQGYCRRMSTKVNALVTAIDDIYDVYGTLDELQLFTDAVERWDIEATNQLPDYMKACYLTLYNSANEMARDAFKEQGANIISYLSKAWADLCRTYLREAEWYATGYTPTLEEYLNNAWISISAPVILVHAYFFVTNPVSEEALESLDKYHNVIRCSAMILRLANDLGTSSEELKRGDVPKSIQCYMNETGASEEVARKHIKVLISHTWKQMNKERFAESPFSQTFTGIAMNLARMAQCMYQCGDGHGHQNSITRHRILGLLFHPIDLGF